jgi:hypothetical protein
MGKQGQLRMGQLNGLESTKGMWKSLVAENGFVFYPTCTKLADHRMRWSAPAAVGWPSGVMF